MTLQGNRLLELLQLDLKLPEASLNSMALNLLAALQFLHCLALSFLRHANAVFFVVQGIAEGKGGKRELHSCSRTHLLPSSAPQPPLPPASPLSPVLVTLLVLNLAFILQNRVSSLTSLSVFVSLCACGYVYVCVCVLPSSLLFLPLLFSLPPFPPPPPRRQWDRIQQPQALICDDRLA
eukprot:2149273-Rhodomonas_salina.3